MMYDDMLKNFYLNQLKAATKTLNCPLVQGILAQETSINARIDCG